MLLSCWALLVLLATPAMCEPEPEPEADPQYWSLRDKGQRECPPVTERHAYECVGAKANCWSPGMNESI